MSNAEYNWLCLFEQLRELPRSALYAVSPVGHGIVQYCGNKSLDSNVLRVYNIISYSFNGGGGPQETANSWSRIASLKRKWRAASLADSNLSSAWTISVSRIIILSRSCSYVPASERSEGDIKNRHELTRHRLMVQGVDVVFSGYWCVFSWSWWWWATRPRVSLKLERRQQDPCELTSTLSNGLMAGGKQVEERAYAERYVFLTSGAIPK